MAKGENYVKPSTLKDSFESYGYRCAMCNREFKTHETLQAHFRQHAFQVDIYGKPNNQSTPTDLQLIQCEFCPDILQSMSKAIGHKYQKHRHIDINYFCEQCGKLFPIKIALEQHQTLEHNDNRIKTINKRNIISDNKNTQKKVREIDEIKDKNSKLICTDCSATFLNKTALQYHQKHTHKIVKKLTSAYTPPASNKIENVKLKSFSAYYCHLCGSEYYKNYNLQKHILKMHNEEQTQSIHQNSVRCETCDVIFFGKDAYVNHLSYHIDEDVNNKEKELVCYVHQDIDHNHMDEYVLPEDQILISNQENQIHIKNETQIKDSLYENECLEMLSALIHEDDIENQSRTDK